MSDETRRLERALEAEPDNEAIRLRLDVARSRRPEVECVPCGDSGRIVRPLNPEGFPCPRCQSRAFFESGLTLAQESRDAQEREENRETPLAQRSRRRRERNEVLRARVGQDEEVF
jgi:hypothetical protein